MGRPSRQDDDISADEDNVVNGDLFADNGYGVDSDPDGDIFTVSAVDGNASNVGVQINTISSVPVTINGDGSFTYDPTGVLDYLSEGDTVADSLSYEITDGLLGSNIASVNITVDGVNDAPEASIDNIVTDGAIQLTLYDFPFDFLGTHSDIDENDTHDVTIDWGDGLPDNTFTGLNPIPSSQVNALHTYAIPGLFDLSFTADDGRSVNNTAVATVKVAVGNRGDCNGDAVIDAGDLPAWVLEFFDGDDNLDWLAAVNTPLAGSVFAGNPMGCDTNANTDIDVPDLVCTIKKVLTGEGAACSVVAAAAGEQQATLTLPRADQRASGTIVEAPIALQSNGHEIAAAVFSIDLTGLVFDPSDGDGDGVPDALAVRAEDMQVVTNYNPSDDGGELDVAVFSMQLNALPDGELVTVALQVTDESPGASFSAETTPLHWAVWTAVPCPSTQPRRLFRSLTSTCPI